VAHRWVPKAPYEGKGGEARTKSGCKEVCGGVHREWWAGGSASAPNSGEGRRSEGGRWTNGSCGSVGRWRGFGGRRPTQEGREASGGCRRLVVDVEGKNGDEWEGGVRFRWHMEEKGRGGSSRRACGVGAPTGSGAP
jgi:hypothetical protein